MGKPIKNEYTYVEFIKDYPNDDACLDKIFEMTYGKMECCPKCKGTLGYVRLKGKRQRKAYQCRQCYNQIHPCAGTIFERTRIPLSLWFYAIHLFTISKNGLSCHEVCRAIKVSPKTSLRMLKEIRRHIQNDESKLSNEVETDECLIGGLQKFKHADKRVKGTGGRSTVDKSLVFGMMERGGRVIAHVIEDAKQATLHKSIFQHVTVGSDLLTDEYNGYNGLGAFYNHQSCNHKKRMYAIGKASTNCMENFWSCLKRTIKGSYIKVSRKYLHLYVKEAVFRHNYRKSPNMFYDLLNSLLPSWV